jgi:porphobilinogen synthase
MIMSEFPTTRLRRLRGSEAWRAMTADPMPTPAKLIWPVFVVAGENRRETIDSMPGQYRLSCDELMRELEAVVPTGIGGVLLFGVAGADEKDAEGSAAWDPSGAVQQATALIRSRYPSLAVTTDVCLCAYTSHGHCGVLDGRGGVDNDATLERLTRVARSHAEAGAECVAPSAMMDGQVAAIRGGLDAADLSHTMIMSYSTKFASSMYGPFREAEQSAPQSGDRRGYQSDYANPRLALRESALDEAEGADILMVKPALFYLDVLSQLRTQTQLPLAAYNVSGEYAMLHATADRGWGDLGAMARESLMAISRAGADIIITYWANQVALLEGEISGQGSGVRDH